MASSIIVKQRYGVDDRRQRAAGQRLVASIIISGYAAFDVR